MERGVGAGGAIVLRTRGCSRAAGHRGNAYGDADVSLGGATLAFSNEVEIR